jgi:hypothetical protein
MSLTVLRNSPGRPPHRQVDVRLLQQRFVPRGRLPWALAGPRAKGDRFDRLHRDAALLAKGDQRRQVGGVLRIAELSEVVREEHAVEGKALEALAVAFRDIETMPGHADEPHHAGIPCLDGSLQRTVEAEGDFPLTLVDEVVELDEVDVVDPQAPQREPNLIARLRVGALSRLRR